MDYYGGCYWASQEFWGSGYWIETKPPEPNPYFGGCYWSNGYWNSYYGIAQAPPIPVVTHTGLPRHIVPIVTKEDEEEFILLLATKYLLDQQRTLRLTSVERKVKILYQDGVVTITDYDVQSALRTARKRLGKKAKQYI